jgi:tetratricopeptide (TPR) repeat protein
MSDLENFEILLNEIDVLLESYNPGELAPDRVVSEIFAERAKQRPIFEKVVQLTTSGLEKYPYNSELLRRRAYARCRIVTPDGEYPELELAEKDLRTILKLDPNNLRAGFELLEVMFTFSGMDDKEVAEVAGEFAERSERLLLKNLTLQIKALGYAGEYTKAEEVYRRWIKLFPDSDLLNSAKSDLDSVNPGT